MSEKSSINTRQGGEIVRPAFDSDWQAVGFLALVLLTLVLPILISASGEITRRDSYEMMPENQGAFSFVKNEIFDNDDAIDLLFVGSSVTFATIDAPLIERELSRRLGRPARVLTFGHYFNSADIGYMQVRDCLARKKVRMIVLSVPRVPFTDSPSPTAYRFLRYSDDPDIFNEMPVKAKISLYAASVLRAPRDVLTIVRPNLLQRSSPFAKNLGADKAELGRMQDPLKFVRFAPAAPSIPPEQLIYSPKTAHAYQFLNGGVTDYQHLYLEKLLALLEREKVPAAMINIPQYTERHSEKIIELEDWSKVFGREIPLVGVPPARLFAGLSEEEIDRLFYDDIHFNANGNEFFTQTILPAVLEVYERESAKNR